MNKDNALQYLPFVQALADGELEFNVAGNGQEPVWSTQLTATFAYPPEYYRRKPKPREWLVSEITGGNGHITNVPMPSQLVFKTIRVREVLE